MKSKINFFSTFIIVILFILIAIASGNENKEKSNSTKDNKISEVDNSCTKCGGSKTISTYGCDPSHFELGDCLGGHKSEYNCMPTGKKTCPCCNGSGKSN